MVKSFAEMVALTFCEQKNSSSEVFVYKAVNLFSFLNTY